MGKIPYNDFARRTELDGTEELFSQNPNHTPTEQRFTSATLASYILAQISQNETNTSGTNGLSGTSDLGLGGALIKNTAITVADFDLRFEKGEVSINVQNSDKENVHSANLFAEHENGNWAILSAKKAGSILLASQNAAATNTSRLSMTPFAASLNRLDGDYQTKWEQIGSKLTAASTNIAAEIASYLTLDVTQGTTLFDAQILELKTGANGELRIITQQAATGVDTAPKAGYVLALQDEQGRVEYQSRSLQGIKTIAEDYTIKTEDNTLLLNAEAGNINVTLPDATAHEGYLFRLVSKYAAPNAVILNTEAGDIIEGQNSNPTATMANAPDVRLYQSDGKDWVLVGRY